MSKDFILNATSTIIKGVNEFYWSKKSPKFNEKKCSLRSLDVPRSYCSHCHVILNITLLTENGKKICLQYEDTFL